MSRLALIMIPLVVSLYLPPAQAGDTISLNIHIAEAPPTARVLAGYGVIGNTGDHDITIESIHSALFEAIEIHETIVQDDMAGMRPIDELTIPSGTELALEPGGRHLMLIRPVQPLSEGDRVPLEFTLRNGNVHRTMIVVKKPDHDHSRQHHHP